VTIEQVRAAVAAMAGKDTKAARALLAKYEAQSVSALKPEHYAAVLAGATA